MKTHLSTLLAYHRWADDRYLSACRGLSSEGYIAPFDGGWSSIRSIIVHLAGAAEIWTSRLRGESPTQRPTENELPTLENAVESLRKSHNWLTGELACRDDSQLAAPWTYHTLDGSSRTIPLWSVFNHVVNHGTYHRGQLANRLARRGVVVPVTDLVIWAAEADL